MVTAVRLASVLLLLGLGAVPAPALETAARPELPPADVVRELLDGAPAVQAARHELEARSALARQLQAGPYEWTLSGELANRNVRPEDDRNYGEYAANLERSFRIGGKTELDQRLGEAGEQVGRYALAQARHERARELLQTWFDWLAAEVEVAASARRLADAEGLRRIAGIRLEQGDAAELDLRLAEGAVGEAAAQAAARQARRDQVVAGMDVRFPGLRPAAPLNLPEPGSPESLALDPARMLESDAELARVRALAREAQLAASRADADRLPDPTVGLRLGSEFGGDEQVVGLRLSMPLGGAARRAASDSGLAMARSAAAQEAQFELELRGEANRLATAVRSSWESWQRLRESARTQAAASALLERAWTLGEGSLADLLAARRTAQELALAENLARVEALAAQNRWRLEVRDIWAPEQ